MKLSPSAGLLKEKNYLNTKVNHSQLSIFLFDRHCLYKFRTILFLKYRKQNCTKKLGQLWITSINLTNEIWFSALTLFFCRLKNWYHGISWLAALLILNLFSFPTVWAAFKTKCKESNKEILKDCNIMLASCSYLQILKVEYLLGYTISLLRILGLHFLS